MVNAFSQFEELIELNANLENLDDGSPAVEHLDEDYDSFDEETLAFDDIDNSVIEEVVENLSEDLEKAHPKSLLIMLRNAGMIKNCFTCACHTVQLAVKDLLATLARSTF